MIIIIILYLKSINIFLFNFYDVQLIMVAIARLKIFKQQIQELAHLYRDEMSIS